jgi:hypothetical protein
MPEERPSPRGIDTRTESLDEPTGSIEFGPRRAAITTPDTKAMHEKAEARTREPETRPRRERPARESMWRRLWRNLRGANP